MTAKCYDIVFVADARFEGGSSTSLAAEIKAAARTGWRTGLLMVKGPIIGLPLPVHAAIRNCLERGLTDRIDPSQKVEARLLIVHHPSILLNPLQPRPSIEAGKVIVVLHHPVHDRGGSLQYDLAVVVRNCRSAFGGSVLLAPVSAVVRASLPRHLPKNSTLLPEDWHNTIDLADWPRRELRPVAFPARIGRHSRPHPQKWPDTLRQAKLCYPPDGDRYEILMLGGSEILDEHYGDIPDNWDLMPFSFDGIPTFLQSLDFYVYFHSDTWSEAFGRAILEALATGLVTILPEHFKSLFGDAALYTSPSRVKQLVDRYIADPDLYAVQSMRARRFVEEQHELSHCVARIQSLLQPTEINEREKIFTAPILPIRTVLFLSSNGIGMGHLTRQMAIADRLPADIKPVFATMSYAVKVAIDAGYQAHFFGHHRATDANVEDWRAVFAEELFDLVSHLKPAMIVYDATAVYEAVTDVMALFPEVFTIWVRRPMWRENHKIFLEQEHHFDTVIEPLELAGEFDHGPTKACQTRTYLVPPVLQVAPEQRIESSLARDKLQLPHDKVIVALQLGSGSNFEMQSVRSAVIEAVLAHSDTVVVEFQSSVRPAHKSIEPSDPRHFVRECFPIFRYSLAFDVAVSTAGYNTFHESIAGAIPTLFVPNEAPEMDLQYNRARWAELNGYGWVMRRDIDLPHCRKLISLLLDPWEREHVKARCKAMSFTNGADEIAAYVVDHARLVRSDRMPFCS